MKRYQVNANLSVGLKWWLKPSLNAISFCARHRALPARYALAAADWLIDRGVVVRVGSA